MARSSFSAIVVSNLQARQARGCIIGETGLRLDSSKGCYLLACSLPPTMEGSPVREFFCFCVRENCESICLRRTDRRPTLIVADLTKETRGGVWIITHQEVHRTIRRGR